MTLDFHTITGNEVELFVTYPNLFTGFWFNNDILMEYEVSDHDMHEYQDYYNDLFKFGAIRKHNDLIVPSNLPFTIVKTKSPQAYFDIKRGYTTIEITDLYDLSITADLTPLGEKVYQISNDLHIDMLEAIEQLIYYASILNVNIDI